MDPMRWGILLVQWFRRPPSRERLILMGVVIALCIAVFAIERIFGWPAWLTVDRMPRPLRHP